MVDAVGVMMMPVQPCATSPRHSSSRVLPDCFLRARDRDVGRGVCALDRVGAGDPQDDGRDRLRPGKDDVAPEELLDGVERDAESH